MNPGEIALLVSIMVISSLLAVIGAAYLRPFISVPEPKIKRSPAQMASSTPKSRAGWYAIHVDVPGFSPPLFAAYFPNHPKAKETVVISDGENAIAVSAVLIKVLYGPCPDVAETLEYINDLIGG